MSQILQKLNSKSVKKKLKKMAKSSHLWAYCGIIENLDLFRPKFRPAIILYLLQFLQNIFIVKPKSPAIICNESDESYLVMKVILW